MIQDPMTSEDRPSCHRCGGKMKSEGLEVPLHAFEVRISIGANTREYLVEVLAELFHDSQQRDINTCSGGWNGSYNVTTVTRDVAPDQYRKELDEWRKNPKKFVCLSCGATTEPS